MLVDPRPYTYEYRTPRYANPTFQSRNLYESLYHKYPYQSNDYFTPQERGVYASSQKLEKMQPSQREVRQLERNLSEVKDRRPAGNIFNKHEQFSGNPQRQVENYKLPSINKNSERPRVESNLGYNMGGQQRESQQEPSRKGFQRFRVYQRQQKPFNIISCYPKEMQSSKLRNFPKLTLEDKLIERGSYHTFNQQKF